jgi:predicted nuclease of predicted toxin-antitoxin system
VKLLLDECLPIEFRHSFPGHDAHTAEWAGFKGKKNGELLSAAEAAGYQVLITVDQGIHRQVAQSRRKLAIIIVRAPTNQVEDLREAVPMILGALESLMPGQVVSVPSPI